MPIKQELEADFAKLQNAVTEICLVVDDLRRERKMLRAALQTLYDACPTGYGNDRALNEAQILAEKVLREVEP